MFKHYLRQHREAKNWTQDILAEKCGTFPSVISRFESGGRAISLEMAVRLCRALEIKLGQLLEPPRPGPTWIVEFDVTGVNPQKLADIEQALKATVKAVRGE